MTTNLSYGATGHPRVSVIVPTRNSSQHLERCLRSLVEQSYSRVEIIVVDNHSSDGTPDIARRYTELVYDCGPERSAQVNFGVDHASGEYVYKVDSDFVLDSKVIESCIDEISKGFDAIVVHNSPDPSVSWIAKIRKFEVDMYKYDLTHSSARFVKKSTFQAVGGFNESITAGEDYDFQNRLNRAGFCTGFIEPEALHLGEPTDLWKHLWKYFHYGKNFVHYRSANRQESKDQLRFVRRAYVRNWRCFVRHPVLGSGLAIYSSLKFLFGGCGLLLATLGSRPDHAGT
jgi:glycosyltransferase involved in cell wall biosynthesis